MLLEPTYSNFYSVAPDLELSSQLKRQIDSLIDGSPRIRKHFRITNKQIYCTLTKTTYKPLANSNNRLDAREPVAFLADEVGALPNNYPIKAMQSGQSLVENPLGIIISTAYDSLENPMTEEVQKAEDKIKPGELYDPTYFALLYRPDNPKEWATNEQELLKVNPLAQEIEKVKEYIDHMKDDAIHYPADRSNFLTKYMNIFVDGDAGEAFVTEDEINACELHDDYEWYGRDVYVGMDFAQSRDNFGITMIAYDPDYDKFVAKSWAIYAHERESEKSKIEGVPYREYSGRGWVIPTGARTIDYGEAEDFVMSLSDTYGVNILGIGYDKWNARSSVARFEAEGEYDCVEVPQDNRGVYPPTKFLRECIENERFAFDKNDFYKTNYMNATMITDMNLSYHLNKKKSKGRIDMVAATIDAMALWQQANLDEIISGEANITLI